MNSNSKKILITGATGNVGMEVIRALGLLPHSYEVIAAIRDFKVDKEKLAQFNIGYVRFDFTDISTYKSALKNCSILFLLRPPQIADVEKYFYPLIEAAKECGVVHIVFLSVQGVEKSRIIPHHKIEQRIVESKIPYTFLRPAYFMQNFTTTLRDDLFDKKIIYLPAGQAKFTLVDVRDIGCVGAHVILNYPKHTNRSYELTCDKKWTFKQMAAQLSIGLGTPVTYISPNLISFFLHKRKENVAISFIFVLILLHYIPRFQKVPLITTWIYEITGNRAIPFEAFVEQEIGGLYPKT